MRDEAYSGVPRSAVAHTAGFGGGWAAPVAARRLAATVELPGSKSLTNRELVLSALATGPSTIRSPLRSRDTDLMIAALRSLGTRIEESDGESSGETNGESDGRPGTALTVTPGPVRGRVDIDVGLAGTVMRFLPPLAALAAGPVRFDGDERARTRPMAPTIASLRALGVRVDDGGTATLPFTLRGAGSVAGGGVVIDASESSQFVSGLLLAAARFEQGIELTHRGGRLPSMPHIEMTIACLAARGVQVDIDRSDTASSDAAGTGTTGSGTTGSGTSAGRWIVRPGSIGARTVDIEPDLSNAAPFLAAALVVGGAVTVRSWPHATTQVGDRLRQWLPAFGATAQLDADGLTVDGGEGVLGGSRLRAVDLDLSAGGELAPTLVGLAAFADGASRFTGIGHLRGHETDRLAALAAELEVVGCRVEELAEGLVVYPAPLSAPGRPWRASGDHRMATTGALIGLAVRGLVVDDIGATAKTMPDFPARWSALLA